MNEWINELERTAFDRGQTDHISLARDLDIDLWPWTSIHCELCSCPTHMQKFKVNDQSVTKIEWKQTDGQTDRRTEAIALPAALMRSVTIAYINVRYDSQHRPGCRATREVLCYSGVRIVGLSAVPWQPTTVLLTGYILLKTLWLMDGSTTSSFYRKFLSHK